MKAKGHQLDMFATYAPSSRHAYASAFGGSLLKSHPKRKRPIFEGKAHHIVMKTRELNLSENMRRRASRVREIVEKAARKWQIKLHRFENVGNHLHILMTPKKVNDYQGFIRSISGAIALLCAEKAQFWLARPFTRLVKFGRDYIQMQYYLNKNRLQAVGFDIFFRELQQGVRSTA